jgi:next-to-BRCA1 protein 1
LIKLKTPVRNVNVSTENEDNRGNVRLMGDRRVASPSESASANAAAPVQTVAEIMPTEVKKEETLPIPIPVKKFVEQVAAAPAATGTLLNAHFVQDTIRDGMKLSPETRFTQTWTLINPGPLPWPTGCSVRYVGGDNMLNVDNSHPASVAAIAEATESNVVGRAVFPGEKIGFTVSMKAPVREGKAISYWRLKAADGTPFGHRLWCDIEVVKPEEPSPAAAQIFIPELNMQAQMQAQNQTRAAQLQQQQRHAAQIQAQMQAQQQHQRTLWQAAADLPYAQVAPHYPQTVMQQHQQQHQVNGTVFNASSFTMSPPPKSSGPNFAASDEGAKLAARFSAMREQQKARREQMIAQMNAQREQQQRQAALGNDGVSYTHTSPTIQRTDETEAEKQRREALKQRVAHIKANILKTREEREQAEKAEKKAKDNEKVQNILAQLAKAEEKTEEKTDEKLSDSKMVFPKLDKESPASSTYESATSSTIKGKAKAAYVENENGEVERSAAPAAPALPELASPSVEENDGFVDLDDELEVFSADGDDSDEEGDGFMTDEEYDILDASDAETVASGWRG